MRHSRPLNSDENWELAVLLGLLVLICAGLTLFWRVGGPPRLWATTAAPLAGAPDNHRNMPGLIPRAIPSAAGRVRIGNRTASHRETTSRPVAAARPESLAEAISAAAPADAMGDAEHSWSILHRRIIRRRERHHVFLYHGRRYVYWKTFMLRVTSYAPDWRSCRPYSGRITACGESVRTNGGHLVAADTRLIPFHYMVRVPGYDHGRPVPVLDHGGAIRGYRLDVLLPTFRAAQGWGVRLLRVKIYRPITGAVSLR